ncbi:GfV-D2-ORF2 [Ichnoviriform fumiferanae]|uniref:GfV-D2-ORF2 n=1 Tax=Ichnoviriform fumiferanae TaxID=419435 RepID=A2PZZ3_9VIRU|nr:GfV-D2-ORF2 [Ichnoviriform fumiferanae]BAF45565.1 GfV-D2-ORF2 [Ichnoviriform fumiferanae]
MAYMKKRGEDITDTYIADNSLRRQFFEWRSAMLDLLLEFYDESLPPIPNSMIDFNSNISHNNDLYVKWLDTHISAVEDSDSFITALQIINQMEVSYESCDIESLKSAMAAWAKKNKYTYRNVYVYLDEQKHYQTAECVILNAAFCNTAS